MQKNYFYLKMFVIKTIFNILQNKGNFINEQIKTNPLVSSFRGGRGGGSLSDLYTALYSSGRSSISS